MKAWVVPLLLGLVVAAATMTLGPRLDTRKPPQPAWMTAAEPGYIWPFDPGDVAVAASGNGVLLVAPQGPTTARNGLERDGFGTPAVEWWTPRLGFVPSHAPPPGGNSSQCGCIRLAEAPSVQATVYVFREGGTLLASNDDPARVARFEPDGLAVPLPDATWYLGNGSAPTGTQPLPPDLRPLLEAIRPALAGLRVGGVATAAVLEHPSLGAVGPLYVTLRLDALGPAGPA